MLATGTRLPFAPRSEEDRLIRTIHLQEIIGAPSLDPDELTRRFASELSQVLGSGSFAVILADGRLHQSCETPLVSSVESVVGGDGMAGRCFATRKLLRSDVENGDLSGLGPEMIAVPLLEGERAVGVVLAQAGKPARFSQSDVRSLELVSGMFAAALSRVRALDSHRLLLEQRTETLQALAASEKRFRSAMDASRLGVWDWDIEAGQIAWQGHALEIFGVPLFDGTYETFLQMVHPEDRHQVGVAITAALTSRAEYLQVHRIVWPDGTIRWVMARGQFQFDEDGKAIRMFGVVMDVTERRVLEHQLLQAQKIEALGQLAAGIAHEINTPTQYVGDNLRFISESFTDLNRLIASHRALIEQPDPALLPQALQAARDDFTAVDADFLLAEIPRAVTQALDGVERVTGLVRAMKEFSHPGGDDLVPIDLNHLLHNTATVSRNEWKYLAELVFQLDPELPPVPCRPGEIQQVVLNLIVNAAHAIADRGGQRGTITISTTHQDEIVEIAVSDTGTGIPEATQPKIFEPFFTTKEVGRGTGQGLAISRDIVVKHRGTLTFRTQWGAGSTFLVRLPLHPADTLGPEG